jgi:hypothetical protein
MKKYVYKIIVSDKGFDDFEAKVSEKLNDGWKPIGGIAFNHSYPHQAMAKIIDAFEEKSGGEKTESLNPQKVKSLTANEAMRRIDDLT